MPSTTITLTVTVNRHSGPESLRFESKQFGFPARDSYNKAHRQAAQQAGVWLLDAHAERVIVTAERRGLGLIWQSILTINTDYFA